MVTKKQVDEQAELVRARVKELRRVGLSGWESQTTNIAIATDGDAQPLFQ